MDYYVYTPNIAHNLFYLYGCNIFSTKEKLTPRTGVAIFGEYLKGLDFGNICNRHIPNSIHHKAYDPFEFIYPLILMLHSGGRVLDDIKD